MKSDERDVTTTQTDEHHANVSAYMRLRGALVREEAELMIAKIVEAHGLAIDRDTDQCVILHFNAKGRLVKIEGANSVRPRVYRPE